MKFGGSSVASADRMKEVTELILSFPKKNNVIVLSAMGKTTNKVIVALVYILRTVDELGLDRSLIKDHLDKLEQLLNGIAVLKELTPRVRNYIVSFGECTSTRIFVAYLNKIGTKACQYDVFDIEATYLAVAKRVHGDWIRDPMIPIVTVGKVWKYVDGVLTCDPNIYSGAEPVPYLTFNRIESQQ
ncbi:Aspartate/glutamate/uridylate kinase [Cynara cardunculus var. scolymus]|uniref:Aspartate/glutamate/uridylate kinase n=1 Tax=Cynara cardunculus var. scolymus TaxID=59895 RepID=A0A118INH1_CYNCS|nr:Aspartate/glutamate/uridylate kinase [Cynara cardunculus var. scolymus]